MYHTVEGEVHVSSSERLWEYGDVGAELSGVRIEEVDEDVLRLDDRREHVRETLVEDMEGM